MELYWLRKKCTTAWSCCCRIPCSEHSRTPGKY